MRQFHHAGSHQSTAGWNRILFFLSIFMMMVPTSTAFTSSAPVLSRQSSFVPKASCVRPCKPRRGSSTELSMFMGSDGGILGVGTPELFTILLVGYFILGPSDLYKLVKEIGKFVQNFRTLGSEASKTLEENMESQLALEDLRKAQRELNDAFSFRRSINTEPQGEAFAPTTSSLVEETTATAAATAAAVAAPAEATTPTKKKIRRRVKKRPVQEVTAPEVTSPEVTLNGEPTENVPDLEMPAPEPTLRDERMERLKSGTQPEDTSWFNEEVSSNNAEEQARFAAQLTDDWNQQIMANQDKLSPLAQIMERLAILEEEKKAADARLEEEFQLRTELEEKYYREKRKILEDAAADVQTDAYLASSSSTNATTSNATVADEKTKITT